MSVFSIDCNPESDSFLSELSNIEKLAQSVDNEFVSWFFQCAEKARLISGGYIKKILWDAEGGYPESSRGTIQYSPRPFIQGYGCDGTTDANVHLVALTLCQKLGIDYVAAYVQAYNPSDDPINWIESLSNDRGLMEETILPQNAGPD